jgi:hypothetical protein
MNIPVSVYCNRCDMWMQVEEQDLSEFDGRAQVLCDGCGNPLYPPQPGVWRRAASLLRSVFHSSKGTSSA